jgi:hypothetical protein
LPKPDARKGAAYIVFQTIFAIEENGKKTVLQIFMDGAKNGVLGD